MVPLTNLTKKIQFFIHNRRNIFLYIFDTKGGLGSKIPLIGLSHYFKSLGSDLVFLVFCKCKICGTSPPPIKNCSLLLYQFQVILRHFKKKSVACGATYEKKSSGHFFKNGGRRGRGVRKSYTRIKTHLRQDGAICDIIKKLCWLVKTFNILWHAN